MPYWRLSAFYFFYFASLGALLPYWGPYLQERGFDPVAIGELMAVLMGTKIIAPNLWAWIADHSDRRMAIVRLASLLALIAFGALYFAEGFWGVALVMAGFSFFWNASLPQFEAVTFNYLGPMVHRYSHIRLWGSVGFICTVFLLGLMLEHWPVSTVPAVVMLLFFGIWVTSLAVPEQSGPSHPPQHPSIIRLLIRPEIVALLAACFLMQAGHGAYYTFFTIHMDQVGYSSGVVGMLWALGVLAEVGLFLVMHRLLARFDARPVFLVSLLLAVIRWLMIGSLSDSLVAMLFAQALHAATFGAYHASAIHLIHVYFTGRHQGRGQALYSSISFGAGGAVGALLSGFLWQEHGASLTYGASAILPMLGFLVAWKWVGRGVPRQPEAAG
jgi:PPP family 3-phenylpropionic acid transporter